MSVSNILGSSRVILSAYQTAIDTTARNISNADNPDYVRRRVDIGSILSPVSGLAFSEKDHIDRLESGFIQNQLWYKNQFLGRYSTDELVYSQVESIYNEPTNSGLSSVMNEFWNSWSDLANDPENNTARSIVKDKGVLLSRTFNQVSTDLHNMQREIGYDIQDTVRDVNKLLNEIKSFNEQVGVNFSYDLADARDAAIGNLSKIINIDVSEDIDNIVSITTGGNTLVPLVNGDFVNEMTATVANFSDLYNVNVSFSEGGSIASITGGSLGSLLEVHNDSLPGFLQDLDTLAVSIAEEVNDIHKTGYNLGNITGVDFFDSNVENAATFEVNSNITSNPYLIATSSSTDEAGNGEIATNIADLQNATTIRNGKFSDYYNSMISEVGSHVQEAKFLRMSQEMVVQSLQNQRDSISAVSMDEEMTNLIKYEQAYQAAARLIAVADELIQSVLTLL